MHHSSDACIALWDNTYLPPPPAKHFLSLGLGPRPYGQIDRVTPVKTLPLLKRYAMRAVKIHNFHTDLILYFSLFLGKCSRYVIIDDRPLSAVIF